MSGVTFQALLMGGGGFQNTRSLSFVRASSTYLSQGQDASLDNQKLTLSWWQKRVANNISELIYIDSDAAHLNNFYVYVTSQQIFVSGLVGGATTISALTGNVFSDTTSWHNCCVAIDTTQAAQANKLKIYFDGSSVGPATPTVGATIPNRQIIRRMGTYNLAPTSFVNSLIDEVYYVDGQQLDPTFFRDAPTGKPKKFSGTFNTHSSYWNFEDPTSTATLGIDRWNAKNWTLNNMTTANSSTDHP